MAILIPHIPSDYHGSPGEEEAILALRHLPQEFYVFHSLRWLGLTQHETQGEADILIFHPQIHIPDIRVIIHYLIPESIEQYYQEVGRAGRDDKPAHCYLLFTQTNAKVRLDLIKKGFPTAAQLQSFYDGVLFSNEKEITSLDPIQGLPEESLLCFYLLKSADIFTVACRGILQITAFESKANPFPAFDHLRSLSKNGLMPIISQKSGTSLAALTEQLFSWYSSGAVKLSTSPGKMVFLKRRKPLTETMLGKITTTLDAKKAFRLENATKLIDLISSDVPLDQGVRDHLGI